MADPTVELNSLCGEHWLSGVDMEQVRFDGDYEDANVLRFRLDGVIYMATEDPSDGYRSSMRSLEVVTEPTMRNIFSPVRVVGRMRPPGVDDTDVLEFALDDGQIVLAVGTENTSDYYPYFVAEFDPKALGLIEAGKDRT